MHRAQVRLTTPLADGAKQQVYISYNKEHDRPVAVGLYNSLQRYGIESFLDAPAGVAWDQLLKNDFKRVDIMALLLTRESLHDVGQDRSHYLLLDYEQALLSAAQDDFVVVPIFAGTRDSDQKMVLPFAPECVDLEAFPDAPVDHASSFGQLTVREIVRQLIALPSTRLVDPLSPVARAAVSQDVIMAYKERCPQQLMAPALELPGAAIPRLTTRHGATSSMPIPGLFRAGNSAAAATAGEGGGDGASTGAGASDYTPLAAGVHTVAVEAVVRDVFAETTLTQTYKLETDAPASVSYLYPVDESAAVFEVAVCVNQRRIACRMMERVAGSGHRREVVDFGLSALALEQVQGDIYAVQIGAVPAGATVEITVKYASELPTVDDGAVCYVLPMAIAPPALSPEEEEAEAVILGLQRDIDTVVQRRRESYHDAMSFHISFKMSEIVDEISCPTHQVVGSSLHAKTPVLDCHLQQPILSKDFVLLVRTRNPHAPRLRVEVNETGEPSSVAAVTFTPEAPTVPPRTEAREVYLLLQQGDTMPRQAEEAHRILDYLLTLVPDVCRAVRINVGVFGSKGRGLLWPKGSAPATPTALACAREYIYNALAVSAHPAQQSMPIKSLEPKPPAREALLKLLIEARDAPAPTADVDVGDAFERVCLLVATGVFDYPDNLFKAVKACELGTMRVFPIGVGYGARRHTLSAVAEAANATAEFVLPHDADLAPVRTCAFNISAPQTFVTLEWEHDKRRSAADETTMVPSVSRPVLCGQQYTVYSVPRKGIDRIRSVTINGDPVVGAPVEVNLEGWPARGSQGLLVHRVAARALIRDLEQTGLLERPDDETLRQRVIDLSLRYALPSKFAGMTFVEDEVGGVRAPRRDSLQHVLSLHSEASKRRRRSSSMRRARITDLDELRPFNAEYARSATAAPVVQEPEEEEESVTFSSEDEGGLPEAAADEAAADEAAKLAQLNIEAAQRAEAEAAQRRAEEEARRAEVAKKAAEAELEAARTRKAEEEAAAAALRKQQAEQEAAAEQARRSAEARERDELARELEQLDTRRRAQALAAEEEKQELERLADEERRRRKVAEERERAQQAAAAKERMAASQAARVPDLVRTATADMDKRERMWEAEDRIAARIRDFDAETERLRRALLPGPGDIYVPAGPASITSAVTTTSTSAPAPAHEEAPASNFTSTPNTAAGVYLTALHTGAPRYRVHDTVQRTSTSSNNNGTPQYMLGALPPAQVHHHTYNYNYYYNTTTTNTEPIHECECECECEEPPPPSPAPPPPAPAPPPPEPSMRKRTLQYKIDMDGWVGKKCQSPMGPPGWRHFPVCVRMSPAVQAFPHLIGPAWFQVTPGRIALLHQMSGELLWAVGLGDVVRYGVEAETRQFLVDISPSAGKLQGVYLLESPRFRAIVASVTEYLGDEEEELADVEEATSL